MEDDDKMILNKSNESSEGCYFQFYSKLMNQQNMLQDYVRTSAYFNAIQSNMYDCLI
jgi:hypothetical protein